MTGALAGAGAPAGAEAPAGAGARVAATVAPGFTIAVLVVSLFLFATFVAYILITVLISNPTSGDSSATSWCAHGASLCLGALIGLIGGKAGSVHA